MRLGLKEEEEEEEEEECVGLFLGEEVRDIGGGEWGVYR